LLERVGIEKVRVVVIFFGFMMDRICKFFEVKRLFLKKYLANYKSLFLVDHTVTQGSEGFFWTDYLRSVPCDSGTGGSSVKRGFAKMGVST
jgi:hypothetical protein